MGTVRALFAAAYWSTLALWHTGRTLWMVATILVSIVQAIFQHERMATSVDRALPSNRRPMTVALRIKMTAEERARREKASQGAARPSTS